MSPPHRWGENLVTELMAGSKKRPLLSGYYRLMEMALQLSVQSCLLTAEGSFGQVRPNSLRFSRCLRPKHHTCHVSMAMCLLCSMAERDDPSHCADRQSLAAGGVCASQALQGRAPERSARPAPVSTQHDLPSSGMLSMPWLAQSLPGSTSVEALA